MNSNYRVERDKPTLCQRHHTSQLEALGRLSSRNPPVAYRLWIMLLNLYLLDVKIPFEVISDYSVEFLWGVQRGFAGLCGDLKPTPADLHQQTENKSDPFQHVNTPGLVGLTSIVFL